MGVTFEKQRGKWKAVKEINRHRYYIGRYDTKKEAQEAFNNFVEQNIPVLEDHRMTFEETGNEPKLGKVFLNRVKAIAMHPAQLFNTDKSKRS